jgi:hypothetical protein
LHPEAVEDSGYRDSSRERSDRDEPGHRIGEDEPLLVNPGANGHDRCGGEEQGRTLAHPLGDLRAGYVS